MSMENGKIDRWNEALRSSGVPQRFRHKDATIKGTRFAKFADGPDEFAALNARGESILLLGGTKALDTLYLLTRCAVLYSLPAKIVWIDTLVDMIEQQMPIQRIEEKLKGLDLVSVPMFAVDNYAAPMRDEYRYRIERLLLSCIDGGTSLILHADSAEALCTTWSSTIVSRIQSNARKEVY